MADNNFVDDDVPTRRESHYNNQRSSYRSSLRSDASTSANPRTRTQSERRRLDDFNLDLEKHQYAERNAETDSIPSLESAASPAPNVPFTRSPRTSEVLVKKKRRSGGGRASQRSTIGSRAGDERIIPEESLIARESWLKLYEQNAQAPDLPAPLRTPKSRRESTRGEEEEYATDALRPAHPLHRGPSDGELGSITALPSMSNVKGGKHAMRHRSSRRSLQPQASKIATEIYTISYLIFFAIWGTLARVGLQALTFYPGAPVIFSELWANVAGTFIIGFLSEDRRLFAAEWGDRIPEPFDTPTETSEIARHGKVKKTIPLYIGLATGFCGSFTSFSSFMRDVFLSLSNDLHSPSTPTRLPRNNGYSLAALLATLILTLSACYTALHIGAHFALLLRPILPSLPFRTTRRIIDPLVVLLSLTTWLAALLLSILIPSSLNAWRAHFLFAAVFAPLGCLARYYLSLLLNPLIPAFPLGTFAANIFGTAVLGMAFDLQHVRLAPSFLPGGSVLGCQVLQGVMDGFCGALTTVSTWIVEIDALRRGRAYVYAGMSVGVGLGVMLVVMGSVRWSVGWGEVVCRV